MPDEKSRRVIGAYLDEVERELEAVTRLIAPPPQRLAAYHLQQAAEKLTKAVRLDRGLPATIEHRIGVLALALPEGDRWKELLKDFEHVDQYATAYRYPAPSGNVRSGPSVEQVQANAVRLRQLLQDAREELLKS